MAEGSVVSFRYSLATGVFPRQHFRWSLELDIRKECERKKERGQIELRDGRSTVNL